MRSDPATARAGAGRADPAAIIDAIRAVLGASEKPIPLHEPEFRGHEWDYVKDSLDSTFVSYVGAYVGRFEEMLAAATGARFAIATVSGTAAMQMALHLAGVGRDDEVLAPAFTFIGTINPIVHCGAVPHFVDSDPLTLGLDVTSLRARLTAIARREDGRVVNRETGRRLAAIVPVHILGHPADLNGLRDVAAEWDLPLVEDIAEALGTTYMGRPIAADTRYGALSFNGNKIVTTGGGGAILTNDEAVAKRARHVTTTAKVPHKWAFDHDEVGYNYRMPNLNAALGVAQLERLGDFVARKRRLARLYHQAFAGLSGVSAVVEPAQGASNYWLNAILLEADDVALRDEILAATHEAGLLTRPAWTLMHRLPMFASMPRGTLPTAESIERRLIKLPSSARHGDPA